jgi:hypothetical protein
MADSFRAPVRAPGAASSRLRRRSARERQLLSGPLAQACEPLGSSAQVNRPKHHAGTMRRDPLGGWVLGQDVPAVLDQLRDQRPLAGTVFSPTTHTRELPPFPAPGGSMGARVNADRRGGWRSTVPLRSRADCGFCQAGSDLGGLPSTALPACSGRCGCHSFQVAMDQGDSDRALAHRGRDPLD